MGKIFMIMGTSSSGKDTIYKELKERMDIRNIPELEFIYDESIEYGNKIEKIIEEIHNEE